MATAPKAPGIAPCFMMVTFEIAPEDEADFNEIYDNDHIPNILKLKGVQGIVRFRDAEPNAAGWLVYSALYMTDSVNYHETPEWQAASDLGRWAPVIRPRLKSRARRAGKVVASFGKP